MDTDSLSVERLSDEEDCTSNDSVAVTKDGPRDGFLTQLNHEFKKSKAELMERFLLDQAELNRRFGEDANEDSSHATKGKRTEKTLEETQRLLRQRLALRSQNFEDERARTSMGFYNMVECESSGDETDSSETSSRKGTKTEFPGNENVAEEYLRRNAVRQNVRFNDPVQRVVLQPLRPKTSMGRRTQQKQQLITVENENQNLTTGQKFIGNDSLVTRSPSLSLSCAITSESTTYPATSRTSRRLSDFSHSSRASQQDLLTRERHDRVVRLGTNTVDNSPCIGPAQTVQSSFSLMSESYRKKRGRLPEHRSLSLAKDHAYNDPRRSSRSGMYLGHRQFLGKKTDMNNRDMRHSNSKLNLNRGPPLAVVKLPPLDSSVSRSNATRNTLDSACY